MLYSKPKSIDILGLTPFSLLLLLAAAILGMNLMVAAGFAAEEIAALFPLKCPIKLLTGFNCPTCGLGRSLVCLVTGRLMDAWHYHPLGPLGFPVVVGYLLALQLGVVRSRHQQGAARA